MVVRRSMLLPFVVMGALLVAQLGPAGSVAAPAVAPPAQVRPLSGNPKGEIEGKRELKDEWFRNQRAAPLEEVPPGALLRARQQLEAGISSGAIPRAAQGPVGAAGVTESTWTSIGPQPISSEAPQSSIGMGQLPNAGRITALAVHPSDANTVYLGAADGGVWKTTNGGTTWAPITDGQVSLATGSIALDPTNPNTVYVGLGEANNSADSYFGYGVLKSTNGGSSWTLLPDPNISQIFYQKRIARIAVDPNNPNIVYAAGSAGIARSDNGGTTWTTACLATGCWASDVVIDSSTNPSTVYAAHGLAAGDVGNGVYRTTTNLPNVNGSWTKLPGTGANTFPTSNPATQTGAGRIRLSITRGVTPPTMYAIVHDLDGAALLGVWKTTDGGTNWTATTHPESTLPSNSFAICTQCQYNLNIAVFPTDPNVVYALAIELFRSTNGGASWTLVSNGYVGSPSKIHVDQHAFAFFPGAANSFYVGNDGGVYKSTDAGATFTNLNQTLSVTQFYRGAAHPTDPNIVAGGTQDNGTLMYTGQPGWHRGFGGDGTYAYIDRQHPNLVMGASQFLGLARSVSGPHGYFFDADVGIPCTPDQPPCTGGEVRQFVAPFVGDPNDPKVLYAGLKRVYKSSNAGSAWTAISPDLTSVDSRRNAISAIAVARGNPHTIYAGTGSSSLGAAKFWVTNNGGTTWVERTAGLPNRFITSIAVHPTDPNTVYVGLSGFDAGHIWRSTNGGQNWTDVSGTLPNAPVNAVVVDHFQPQRIYIATDVGVFRSTNGGASWASLNSGLPNSVVSDLVLNEAGTRLFAFTHGRGAYALDRTGNIPTLTPTPVPPTGPTCGGYSTSSARAPQATPQPQAARLAPKQAPPAAEGAAPPGGPRIGGRAVYGIPAPSTPADVGPATGPGWSTIVCETFEGSFPTGGWTSVDENPYGGDRCWGPNTFQVFNGTRSAWPDRSCADGLDPANFFYPPNSDSWMVYGPFSLVGATDAEVHFRLWYQLRGQFVSGQLVGDGFFILAFTPETDAWGFIYTGNSTTTEPPTTQGWIDVNFDLTNVPTLGSLLGEPEVYVAWLFFSDSGTSASSIDDGVFVDDVLIHRLGGGPPLPPIAGRDFALRAGPPGTAYATWTGGTQQTGVVVIRWSPVQGIRFFPANLTPYPGNTTSFTDTDALVDEAYCYLEMSVSGTPPVITNFLGFSDFACIYPAGAAGNAPREVTVQLNQTTTARLTWLAPASGSPTSYDLVVHTFSGAPPQTIALGNVLTTTHNTGGQSTCYEVRAKNGTSVIGTAAKVCAIPGISTLGTSGAPNLQDAFDRLRTTVETLR